MAQMKPAVQFVENVIQDPQNLAIKTWPDGEGKPAVYRIQILDRMSEMLDLLSEESSGAGLTDLSRRLGLHKSTAHRLAAVLESKRFVEKDRISGRYRLGSRLMELGLAVLSHTNMDEVARPHLRALVEETGETAHLGILREGEVISLVNVESSQTVRTPTTVGTRTPAHCASLGKAILALSSSEEVETFLRKSLLKGYTQNTITSPAKFRGELRAIRKQGYSVDNEEREYGLRCIAAPVLNHSGEVTAAISIAGPAFRVTQKRVPALAVVVKAAAARISKSLGYSGGDEKLNSLRAPLRHASRPGK